MDCISARPVSRYEDDGMQCVYECQTCYRTYEGVFDAYDNRDTIPCAYGCSDEEGGDES